MTSIIILVLSLSAVSLISLHIIPLSEDTGDDWDKEEYDYEEWMSEEEEEALGGW